MENAYNLVVCSLKATKLKTQKLDAYKLREFRKNCANESLLGEFVVKILNLTVLGAVFPHFAPVNVKFGTKERT